MKEDYKERVNRVLTTVNKVLSELDIVEDRLLKLSILNLSNGNYELNHKIYEKLISISTLKTKLRKKKLEVNLRCL